MNPDCVWPEGECIPDCPSCKRMDELIAERYEGFKEGLRAAEEAVAALPYWFSRDSALRAIREVK